MKGRDPLNRAHTRLRRKHTVRPLTVILTVAAVILAAVAAVFGYYTYETHNFFTVSEYEMTSDRLHSDICAVQLSDLHSVQFGKENDSLVSAVQECEPDIILMTGDMFSRDDKSYGSTLELIKRLSDIAPVYYSLGNHEKDFCESDSARESTQRLRTLFDDLEGAGACALEHTYEDTVIAGNEIRVGGMYGFALVPDEDYFKELQKNGYMENKAWDEVFNDGADCDFLTEFEDTDAFRLLLCHRGEGFVLWNSFDSYQSELILSGHIHRGQIVLPVLGPVFSPEEGFFPDNVGGMYKSPDGQSTLILSKGLGSHGIIPRVNNPGELVKINIYAE